MITEKNVSSGDNLVAANTEPARILNQAAILEKNILDNLYYIQGKTRDLATTNDWYMAVAYTVRSRLMKNWIDTLHGIV